LKIQISLDKKSIDKAIKQLEKYKKKLDKNSEKGCMKIAKKLAEIGQEYATNGFGGALYDGTNDTVVTYEKTDNGYKIIASGNAVCFIEFGAGVYYNGSGSNYPGIKPPEISGIGEYPSEDGTVKGYGKRQAWGFYDNGGLVITHGNPPYSVMYRTKQQLIKELPKIAKEVFSK